MSALRTLVAIGLGLAVASAPHGETASPAVGVPVDPVSPAASPDVAQNLPYYDYDGRITWVRVRPIDARGGGFGGFRGRREPPWAHDYPTAEHNLSKIIRELTYARMRVEDYGGNVLTLDDPRLMQYPLAYMSEPGYWTITQEEADGLREYLLKGGFIIFDDFGGNLGRYDMYNLAEQMARALPELQWVRLDLTADVFNSFFELDPDNLDLTASRANYRGTPVFYGIYENNDPEGRLIAIAPDGGDFGEAWEYVDRGYYIVDISTDAYKVGVNYLVYALTH